MNILRYLKHSLYVAVAMIAVGGATSALAEVGVSVTVGQPGFYGHIDIGDYPYPQPSLIYNEPIIVHRPYGVIQEPIYLHVPPGHAKRWHRYCGRYDACGYPVYFVQSRWYNEVYVPYYHERHGWHEYGWYEHNREWRHHDRYRGHDHDRDRGRGHGHRHGHHRH